MEERHNHVVPYLSQDLIYQKSIRYEMKHGVQIAQLLSEL